MFTFHNTLKKTTDFQVSIIQVSFMCKIFTFDFIPIHTHTDTECHCRVCMSVLNRKANSVDKGGGKSLVAQESSTV